MTHSLQKIAEKYYLEGLVEPVTQEKALELKENYSLVKVLLPGDDPDNRVHIDYTYKVDEDKYVTIGSLLDHFVENNRFIKKKKLFIKKLQEILEVEYKFVNSKWFDGAVLEIENSNNNPNEKIFILYLEEKYYKEYNQNKDNLYSKVSQICYSYFKELSNGNLYTVFIRSKKDRLFPEWDLTP